MTGSISIFVSVICLMSAPVWAQHATDGAMPRKEAEASSATATTADRVAAFAAAHGISAWPRLDGCEYDRAISGANVGLILSIESATAARARWDGRCHVPLRHDLTGIPEGLAKGKYVVAATSLESAPDKQFTSRRLKVNGILGDIPNDSALLDSAMAQICTPVMAGSETDHDCRDRNRKR